MNALVDIPRFPYYLEILKNLVKRDIKVKYQRSSLGFVWTLLNPLFTASIYIFVFSQILRFGMPNYWVYLLSGFFAWNFFAVNLMSGSDVIFANRSIITRVYFPHEILVLSNTSAKFMEFFFELLIVIFLIATFALHRLPASVLAIPYLMVLQILLTLGFVLPIACLRVFYKDVEQVLPIVTTGWFFLTPIVYPPEMMPKQYAFLMNFNPMTGIITAYHDILYFAKFPAAENLLRTSITAVVIFAVGYWIFNHYKRIFAEVI